MKLLFIGHTVGVRYCIESLQDSAHEVVAVFTHPREQHQYDLNLFAENKERWGSFAYNVFDVQNDFGIPVIEYTDINSNECIQQLKNYQPDVIVTIGCRDILKQNFIDSFSYCINLHPFNIPHLRGGGIDSWMILNGGWNSVQYATSHYISPRLDAGNIIARLPYKIEDKMYPIDIFKVRISILGELLLNSMVELERGNAGEVQDDAVSYYYPKLFTPRDGKINLDWSGNEILKFIYAFGYPYAGAFVFLGEAKVSIREAQFVPASNNHPFSIGLVFRKSPTGFCFLVRDGEIHVTHYVIDDEQTKIKLGKFLK